MYEVLKNDLTVSVSSLIYLKTASNLTAVAINLY